jgi:hypothetical protein
MSSPWCVAPRPTGAHLADMKLLTIDERLDPKTLGVEKFGQDAVSNSVDCHCDGGERVSPSASPNRRIDEQDFTVMEDER